MVTAALIGEYSLLIMPFIMTAMINIYTVDEILAARLVSAQLFSMALASIIISLTMSRWNLSYIIGFSSVVIMIANGICATGSSITALVIGRILTGFGEGALMTSASAIIASSDKPHKVYSTVGLVVAIIASITLFLIPIIVSHFGHRCTFWILAICPVLVVSLLSWLPKFTLSDTPSIDFTSITSKQSLSILVAFGALWFGASGLWVFAERIGSQQGLSLREIGFYLAIGQLIGIAGPLAAANWGLRFGLIRSLVTGCLFMAVGGGIFVFAKTGVLYALGASLLSFFVMFLAPCFRTLMANIDPVGRVVGVSAAFYTVGFAIAPAAVTLILKPEHSYASVAALCGFFFLLSAILLITTASSPKVIDANK